MKTDFDIFLGHPAHYHLFKRAALRLQDDGFAVRYLIKRKDVLEQLVSQDRIPYTVIRDERRGAGMSELVGSVLRQEYHMLRELRSDRPRLLAGTTLSCAARLGARVPVVAVNEDDAAVVPRYAGLAYPFASDILSPQVCDNGRWNAKSTRYPSYHELAYLHPDEFTPDRSVPERYGIDSSRPYFILRFAKLTAHHDKGIRGISDAVAERLIDRLRPFGNVYITSEREFEAGLEPYRLHVNPADMHHVMAFAALYVGDSQTMAAEAGVLGVPFVRFNDFVGRIGYLREMEDVYRLGYGIRPSDPETLYRTAELLAAMPAGERSRLYQERRGAMLRDKIDLTRFLVWYLENYPASSAECRAGVDWNRWK